MSLDFAVIPAMFHTTEEALTACDELYDGPGGDPPDAVTDLIEELDRRDAIAEEGGFLSMWPVDASALGAILCTRAPLWDSTIYTLLQMTKDRSLAMVDLQSRQVFDPRGRIDVEVTIANGTRLPYLTEQIVADVMANQAYYGDYLVVKRAENTYIQALYRPAQPCQVEHRAGGPDRHFQTSTTDRSVVPRLISAWLQHGPDAPLLKAQHWQRLQV